ncbi:hypothetical protein AMELA_G00058860 [Ameiurus melas]|uniref:Septin-type G domain-containing protein n=1 Tax=Ameiurus melas TaxID=219545 RepID=A0A7J6B133_AMEME|nr:hypothetical protein AMELA_G00058860 [Ameiurus melas]
MATGLQDSSLTVRDLIQKSKFISEGPPRRYRLLTSRSNVDEKGSVRKWTFGQQDVNMQNKIILVVGETGAGKTTLINAMVNYILGVKFTDEVWFEITEEGGDNHMSDQSESQTNEITVYEIFAQGNPICLTIIDSPGYGDTRGTDVDKQIAENLYKLFHNDTGVKEIDAVCLVVKASENRLSDRQQYIFDAVLSVFEHKREALSQTQKALEENREKIKRNENFTFTITKYYKEKVPIGNGSWWDTKVTSCHACKENCHEYNCSRAWSPWWCEVMKNNHCTSCTGKCSYTEHDRESKKYVTLSKEIAVTFEEFKKQYESSNSASDIKFDSKAIENVKNEFESSKKQEEEKTSIEMKLNEELTKKEKEKAELVEEAYITVMKLSEIALKSDSAFIAQCLDFLIPRAEETGKLDYAQRLRELKNIRPESQNRVNVVLGYAKAGFSQFKDAFTGTK